MVHWLWTVDVPLFMSQRRLIRNKKLFPAKNDWALDSGGFSELSMYGEWRTTPDYYIESIHRYSDHIGRLQWAACQDWMCEPFIIEKTRQNVSIHQQRTIESFLYLRDKSPVDIIPILQGFTLDEYHSHVEQYYKHGVDLETYKTVGIGSVCRRQGTEEVSNILKSLNYLNLHGFGVKKQGLVNAAPHLTSADSMAWSFNARYDKPLSECNHANCSSCIRYALKWRDEILSSL